MAGPLDTSSSLEPEVARARRPKWMALMLLGFLVHERPLALSTGTFIELLSRLGTSAHAARSTLTRMVDSGLLERHRRGRETYYALTPHGSRTLREGNAYAWHHADPEWNGTWTVLAYSIPEERRALRLRLRSRLAWGGFGMLRSGVWIAPGCVDVTGLLDGLEVLDDVRVFSSTPAAVTETTALIEEAYDLDEIADRYVRYITRWSGDPLAALPDELCAFLVLRSEWQQLVQADPRLPAEYLPAGWPAAAAEKLFRGLYQQLEGPATRTVKDFAGFLSIE
ncbi:PaaX family transcriptional regulator C-terminal domain-containing protein [Streptomyces sp. NPDC005799]|uniref:PaaX family transcriptional regulator n=1 Tax=Streptomyces sp. NPDC005799 TaxID=3154678 RepID=UPI00340D8F95